MFSEPVFLNYQCGFQKGHSAQQCLLTMTEKWRKCLDSNGACGTLLTDLSKSFDSLPHSLLLAKLHAYGFDKTYQEKKIKINMTFSN